MIGCLLVITHFIINTGSTTQPRNTSKQLAQCNFHRVCSCVGSKYASKRAAERAELGKKKRKKKQKQQKKQKKMRKMKKKRDKNCLIKYVCFMWLLGPLLTHHAAFDRPCWCVRVGVCKRLWISSVVSPATHWLAKTCRKGSAVRDRQSETIYQRFNCKWS